MRSSSGNARMPATPWAKVGSAAAAEAASVLDAKRPQSWSAARHAPNLIRQSGGSQALQIQPFGLRIPEPGIEARSRQRRKRIDRQQLADGASGLFQSAA